MKDLVLDTCDPREGDDLLLRLQALASPHRLRIIASLHRQGRNYVSRMAREAGISRPLMHLHLQRLELAGLVTSKLEFSPDGKALNFYEVAPFALALTPDAIAKAVATLSDPKDGES